MEEEIKRISFIIASKGIKYLEINFRKYVQDTENYKKLKREIKENLNKWRAIPCLWDRSLKHQFCPRVSANSMHDSQNYSRPFYKN